MSAFRDLSETRNGYIQAVVYSSTQTYFLRNSLGAAAHLVRTHALLCFRPGVHNCFSPPKPRLAYTLSESRHMRPSPDRLSRESGAAGMQRPDTVLIRGAQIWRAPALLFQPLALAASYHILYPSSTYRSIGRSVHLISNTLVKLDRSLEDLREHKTPPPHVVTPEKNAIICAIKRLQFGRNVCRRKTVFLRRTQSFTTPIAD